MVNQQQITKLSNGLTLIVEEMDAVKSVAYTLIVPTGIVHDKIETIGASLLLTELTTKGAGNRSSRELSEAFDDIGARHSESSSAYTASYSGSLLAENLDAALPLVADMVRRPQLPKEEIDNIRSLLLQDIYSIKDNPSRRVMNELTQLYFPEPFNRPSSGEAEGIGKITINELKELFERTYSPNGAVLSIAGNVNAVQVEKLIQNLFSDWKGEKIELPKFGPMPKRGMHHIQVEAAQLQISLAYPSTKFAADGYYASRVASDILSGGMFGRLFIEVREKRGLCYTVYLSTSSTSLSGVNVAYAGTTPERAQETFDVMMAELKKVKGTVTEEELSRSKANIKASLVMSEESSASRAGSNASDWWWLQRLRSLDEIQDSIQAVTFRDIDRYFEDYPCDQPMIVTLGSKELKYA